jgi:GT2 family glycosyltransferase
MIADLTLSIISADNLALLLPCLRAVFDATRRASLEVRLVDNASADGTAEAVRAAFPQVEVIRNEQRLGFSTNNNRALAQAHGRYLMLLNDDTLVQPGALDSAVEFMDAHPDAGMAGCYLCNPDGTFQPYFARFPDPVIEGIWAAGNWSYRLIRDQSQPFAVDSVCGAALIARRSAVDQAGMLDTAFDPIYSEEIDWCYRVKRAGWKIYALPHARVIHYGGYTMNRTVPRKYELLLSHRALFFSKHRGRSSAFVYRFTLGLTTLCKLLAWSCAGLIRRGDRVSADKLTLHWYILKRIPSL